MNRTRKTMDGNTAAAHVSYAFTDVAAIYPITPSSTMAEVTDKWAADGLKNMFGEEVKVVEMQSEAGAAGAVHGSLAAGALTTTFTASQGLLLMIPNMYKIAGELLPGVINVSARALATHALSIFGDHSDVYACRQTGFAMLCEGNVQEVMDLTPVAHLAAIKGRVPFLNFFDGFRTSHEIQKIEQWDYEQLKSLTDFDAIDEYRRRALNPEHPVLRGSAQNPDVFFQAREASNPYYEAIPDLVNDYMDKINKMIGTDYAPFNYYGAKDATKVIVAMGSVCDTIEETIDYLVEKGEKVGLIKVRLYRPFSAKYLLNVLPKTVKNITVLDRTKEPGAIGEPLFLDVVAALKGSEFESVPVFNGRYGLGSKDTTPAQIIAVYRNEEKQRFTIGINDDVTHLSLDIKENPNTTPESTISCKFWGLGSDGTVGANKNSIKIIGDHTDMYAQAYFDYDSKKSGGVTVSHLRFGHSPIKSTYLVNKANFVACHNESYLSKYHMVEDLKDGGTFLLNCSYEGEEVEKHLPNSAKKYMAEHNIKFYVINGIKIGKEIGLNTRINTVLQAAFFKLAGIIPVEDAVKYMKDKATETYGRKGEAIVKMNHDAIDRGINEAVEYPVNPDWKNLPDDEETSANVEGRPEVVDYVNKIMNKVNAKLGDTLPVSAFKGIEDGTVVQGSAAYEKRGVAVDVPEWDPEKCIQCNICSYVCPHAAIRPVAMTEEEAANAPEGTNPLNMMAMPGYKFAISVSALDCTGCGSCVNVCPGMKGNKALSMKPIETQLDKQAVFDYGVKLPDKTEVLNKFKDNTVKGSQFRQPLLEFSGACAGCGETPYAKLATQLFGDRMYIANATGCSSIWGGSSPSTPYTVNKAGKGPAWANSLFEDNAEFGYGMLLAQQAMRNSLKNKIAKLAENADKAEVKEACNAYVDTYNDSCENAVATETLVKVLTECGCDEAKNILKDKDFLTKKSQWIFGGDGWAYDIGFGGLDHVIASGQNVNILVFDTEVYSNTGGQSSKSTPVGAVAKFAAAGKSVKKKDLAQIAMSYGYVYVAQVSQGADYAQCIKAFKEAESYDGPSIIIAYAPCINHGIKGGMKGAQTEEKNAVLSGYWNLFRFDPRRADNGENPFVLDSKEPTENYQDFIRNEVRYTSLERQNPERAAELFAKAEQNAKDKYEALKKKAEK
ncbi:pyruvate:ferredoxin (flavodoxin) oxidoreductase [Falcatimonas sp. MSJ-15]|uniref:pyruvate:ferredoxin (flavodoxin) oxidoreductase n=1 Tax=Falcatimonas sp. MSJ-15 TaxID=2841515 RepID=UPI001C11EE73|nr:pyruvate:ferredoxin (flavodoxin) oxidoreductase [Falcatimonas sp. MSJ-15]MBU5469094.1 pyruvate:ferredoxin (flavodoxin) oxidoreductase [Falcatimonas sp. MSJ-15]